MKKILLNFIIFSQFILANDFNEEEFLQKMNKSLNDFIDSIPMTIVHPFV